MRRLAEHKVAGEPERLVVPICPFQFRGADHVGSPASRVASATLIVLLSLALSILAADEPPRTWTKRDGKTFEASLVAADGLRATFSQPEKSDFVVAQSELAAPDVALIQTWRSEWEQPLIVPTRLAPWPAQAIAPAGDVPLRGEDGGIFTYESTNFRIASELKLPAGTAKDLANVFEATRAALIAIPLGLHAGGERGRYAVSLMRDAESYANAGGGGGTGGYYNARARRMLVLLPNLGIEQKAGTTRVDYGRSLFVLKHEVTHQLMARWHVDMPHWLWEGIAEFVASIPYAQGRYNLQNPGAGMRDYLLKWSKSRDSRILALVPPARLMAMTSADWRTALADQSAYDLYNSSALLTYYFIQQDGGTPLAGFLDALRRGEDEAAAERVHLLRGKTRESLTVELIALGKKIGLEVKP
jgi:hypothetical protein